MKRAQGLRTAGFTLMELLVVVIIIGILATLAVPQYPRVMERVRQTEAINTLGQIYQAERLYYTEWNSYVVAAAGSTTLIVEIPSNTSAEHYFKYDVVGATATFTATATRKSVAETTAGGRAPGWLDAYTISINQASTITKSTNPVTP